MSSEFAALASLEALRSSSLWESTPKELFEDAVAKCCPLCAASPRVALEFLQAVASSCKRNPRPDGSGQSNRETAGATVMLAVLGRNPIGEMDLLHGSAPSAIVKAWLDAVRFLTSGSDHDTSMYNEDDTPDFTCGANAIAFMEEGGISVLSGLLGVLEPGGSEFWVVGCEVVAVLAGCDALKGRLVEEGCVEGLCSYGGRRKGRVRPTCRVLGTSKPECP